MESTPSFERYLESELGWLRALASQLVADAAEVDDLVQETLLAALRNRPEGRGAGGARAWLTTVLRSQVALAWRSGRNRRRREELVARHEELPDASELSAQADAQRALSEAVHSLAEPYRSVILLRYFHGLEPARIAARRNVPAATVRSQLARAHAQLRTTLDRAHGGDSRAWCLAFLPFVIDRSALLEGASSSIVTSVGALLMKHWLLASAVALLSLGLGVAFHGGTPANPGEAARVEREDVTTSDESIPPTRSDVFAETSRVLSSTPKPHVAAPPRGLLRGRVVESSARKPLAHYYVELSRDDGSQECLSTGSDGRFASETEREAGRIVLRLRSEIGRDGATRLNDSTLSWSQGVERQVEWNGVDEVELEVAIGLQVALSFSPPIGLKHGDFRAELFDLDPELAPLESVLFSKQARVRSEPPFVRFEDLGMLSDVAERRLLRIVSDDGLWRGQSWFDTQRPDRIVEISLEPCAVVRFELLGADAQPLRDPSLEIWRQPDGRILRRDANDLFDGGRFLTQVDGLQPGSYRFVARALGMRDQSVELHLERGLELHHEFVLEPLADAAAIRGELRSRSGHFADRVTIGLTAAPGGQFQSVIAEWIERDGVRVAPFEFVGLRPGRYNLQFYAWDGTNRSWQPTSGALEAPAESLVFVCDDVSPLQTLEFDIVDDATGTPLKQAKVVAREGERFLIGSGSSSEALPVYSVSEGMVVLWSASCEGYEPAEGDNRGALWSDGVWHQHVRLVARR